MHALILVFFPICFFLLYNWVKQTYPGDAYQYVALASMAFVQVGILYYSKKISKKVLKGIEIVTASVCFLIAAYLHIAHGDGVAPKFLFGMCLALLLSASLVKPGVYRSSGAYQGVLTNNLYIIIFLLAAGITLYATGFVNAGLLVGTFAGILLVLYLTEKNELKQANTAKSLEELRACK